MNDYYNNLILMVFDHEIKEDKKVAVSTMPDKFEVKGEPSTQLNDDDDSEIRKKEEQLSLMEEEKRRQEIEVRKSAEEFRKKELEMKRKEIEILRKKEEKKKLEEFQRLKRHREEEGKRIQKEFALKQKLLQERHAQEIKILKEREREMKSLEKKGSSTKEIQTERHSDRNEVRKLRDLYENKLTQQQIEQDRLAMEQFSCEKKQENFLESIISLEESHMKRNKCEETPRVSNKNRAKETYNIRKKLLNKENPPEEVMKYQNKGTQFECPIQKERLQKSLLTPTVVDPDLVRSKRAIFCEKSTTTENAQNEPVEQKYDREWVKQPKGSSSKDAMSQTNETEQLNMVNALSSNLLFNYMASKVRYVNYPSNLDEIYKHNQKLNGIQSPPLPELSPFSSNSEGWKMYMPQSSRHGSLDNIRSIENVLLDPTGERRVDQSRRPLLRHENSDNQCCSTAEVTIDRGTPVSRLKIGAPIYSPLVLNVPDVLSLNKVNQSTQNSIYIHQKASNHLVVPQMKLGSLYSTNPQNSIPQYNFARKNNSTSNVSRINNLDMSQSNPQKELRSNKGYIITRIPEEHSNSDNSAMNHSIENTSEEKLFEEDETENIHINVYSNAQPSLNTGHEGTTHSIPEQPLRPATQRLSHNNN